MSKRIVWYKKGIVKGLFQNLAEASKGSGVPQRLIVRIINGFQPHYKGNEFSYEITAAELRAARKEKERKEKIIPYAED